MKKKLRNIFWLAGSVTVLILACQLYWVYYNYRTAKANFNATVNYGLRQSIDSYQLSQNKLPTSLQYKNPSLTFMVRTLPNQDPLALDTPHNKKRFSAEFTTVAVDETHLPELRALVARLLAQQHHRLLNLDTLSHLFEAELARNHIHERFRLSVQHGTANVSGEEISANVNFYKDPVRVRADMLQPNRFLLRQNFAPALVSSLLILLSAGSLFYMGRIINRQARLDGMKTDFINNISHELKTPLSILSSSNEALTGFGAADNQESLQRYLNINAQVISEMNANIDRIIDFNRVGTQHPRLAPVILQDLTRQVTGILAAGKASNVRIEMDDAPFEIVTDPHMMGIILTNLIDNAIKYGGENAQITISARRTAQNWQLQISDDGPGIAAAYLPFIFDQFYRVPTGDLHEIKGYGIGLAHVKALITSLQGRIDAESKPGSGTTFTITFKS